MLAFFNALLPLGNFTNLNVLFSYKELVFSYMASNHFFIDICNSLLVVLWLSTIVDCHIVMWRISLRSLPIFSRLSQLELNLWLNWNLFNWLIMIMCVIINYIFIIYLYISPINEKCTGKFRYNINVTFNIRCLFLGLIKIFNGLVFKNITPWLLIIFLVTGSRNL
jgi:hypothetical protein